MPAQRSPRVTARINVRHPLAGRPVVDALEGRRLLSAGDFDASFGTGGTAATAFPDAPGAVVTGLDTRGGRTVVVGTQTTTATNKIGTVARFTDAGKPDTSFSGDGRLTLLGQTVNDVFIQADGRTLLVGEQVAAGTGYVLRLNVDGSIDDSFGSAGNGRVALSFATASSVRQGADGKIVVGGNVSAANGFAAARLLPSGAFDGTFGTGGQVKSNVAGRAYDVIAQSDGKVILVGDQDEATGTGTTAVVVRLTNAGARDASFDGDGVVLLDYAGGGITFPYPTNDFARSVDVAPDGRIVVGVTLLGGELVPFRLNANGSLDRVFDPVGFSSYNTNDRLSALNDVQVSYDGTKLVGWVGMEARADGDSAVVRWDVDGTVDHTFNPAGTPGYRVGTGLAYGDLQANLDVVAAGGTAGAVSASRLAYADDTGGIVVSRGGSLFVEGTAGADTITVKRDASGYTQVTRNGVTRTVGAAYVFVEANNGNDTVTVNVGRQDFAVQGGEGNDVLTANSVTSYQTLLVGDRGNDTLTGGAGGDVLYGGYAETINHGAYASVSHLRAAQVSDGTDVLRGGAGDDDLDGGTGADDLSGGAGEDAVSYNRVRGVTVSIGTTADDGEPGEKDNVRSDVENVYTGLGDDTVTGSAAANRILTGGGNDRIYGLGGNDTLASQDGNDLIQGGDGNDFIDGGTGADDLSGGAGIDSVDYSTRYAPVTVAIGTSGSNGEAGEKDTVRADVENVYGGLGNDTLTGTDGPNVLSGNSGDDLLVGRGGNDALDGGNGRDRLYGGDGDDTLDGWEDPNVDATPDYLDGGSGYDKARKDDKDAVFSIEGFI